MLNSKIMIAAPAYDGKVEAYHASALSETCKLGVLNGINIVAIYMANDSLIQRARNDIVKMFLEADFDDLVFIDTDQDWKPNDFMRLISHDVDIVAAPVVKKSDIPTYNVKLIGDYVVNEFGLAEVDGVGTGMMRINKYVLRKLWEVSEEYSTKEGEYCRNIFENKIIDGEFYSEDMIFCQKAKEHGWKIFIDPEIQCGHVGPKRWVGNFPEWIKGIK